MVAITVILAAVIAAFVFGMAGQISKTKVVAITAQRTSSTAISLTNMGGQDVGSLESTNVTIDAAVIGTMASQTALGIGTGSTQSYTVVAGKHHVIVVGNFLDSSTSQVLLDTNL